MLQEIINTISQSTPERNNQRVVQLIKDVPDLETNPGLTLNPLQYRDTQVREVKTALGNRLNWRKNIGRL